MKKWLLICATTALLTQTAFAKGVAVSNVHARAVVQGVQQSGAFLTLKNTDATDNVLIGASVSPKFAARTELHTHINDNGVMRMREIKGGIPLPAGQTVELKAGGYHIMFFGLKPAFAAGKKMPITLKFKNGKNQRVIATIKQPTQAASHNHHHGHQPHHH